VACVICVHATTVDGTEPLGVGKFDIDGPTVAGAGVVGWAAAV
jgi:hypothetical protein